MNDREFIDECRMRGMNDNRQREALDRLEALIGQGKPTPGQIGLVDREALLDWLESKVWNCRDTQEKAGWNEAIWKLNGMIREGRFSVTGQGQEERDFNFKDALDSALFELLDKCRENCNHGCHTVDDDTAWDECPDHKFMTDEIDKLRKTNWPEVQAHYSKMADELASADAAKKESGK